MKSVELEHAGFEIKFYETTTEQAKEYGLKASKPIFFEHLLVDEKKRNTGNGKQLLKMVEEYAENNNCDLIFGHIPNDAQFTKDATRLNFFTETEMIKNWLHDNGYAINTDNYHFHKVIKKEKPLRTYSGIGFNNCTESGTYQVFTEIQTKIFTKLSEAKSFYNESNGEKAIWDYDKNELLDARYRK
jgi:GNAT superfamily N-acetyltransferase